MSSTLQLKRSYLPLGYKSDYHALIKASGIFLPILVDLSLKALVEYVLQKSDPLIDLKGRDQRNLIDPNIPATLLPTADEFCFVAGAITKSPKAAADGRDFSIAVNSGFIANEKDHHMLHVPSIERRDFPADVRLETIGRLPGVHIQRFRLGFDIFESRFLSSLIGLVPTVSQTLLLEADEQKCEISIVAEGMRIRNEQPLQRLEIWERIRMAVLQALDFDVESDYQSQVQRSS